MLTPKSRLRAPAIPLNPGNSGDFLEQMAPGPGVALRSLGWVGYALGLLPVALSGCLVTDEITFDQDPDLPTVIVDAPGTQTPIGSSVWVDKSTMPDWKFDVRVRDENLAQDLIAHYRVVTQDAEFPPFETVDLKGPAASELRDLTLSVKSEQLRDGECHQLELAVSGSFFDSTRPVFDAVPRGRELDVAYASWQLWEGPGEMLTPDPDLARLARTCEAIEALLAPDLVESAP